jgi:tRNA1Val (adenine37-N6)-methyltransferase
VIAPSDVTEDGFLDRCLTIRQPRQGFRAGHDSVLLAAAVPAEPDDTFLELGSGVGVASLCLATRVPQCRITGIEIDPGLNALANENARRNGFGDRVTFLTGDVCKHDFGADRYDHVFLNPPFHPDTGRPSPNDTRARAMYDDGKVLDEWTKRALALVKSGGVVTVILRADRLDAWRGNMDGAVTVLPLAPRTGEAPKRILAQVRADKPSSFHVCDAFVLHRADGKPTAEAEGVLRHLAPLRIGQ